MKLYWKRSGLKFAKILNGWGETISIQQDYALKAKKIQPKQTEQLIRRKVYIFAFVRAVCWACGLYLIVFDGLMENPVAAGIRVSESRDFF